jgi:xyloglucan galactosyltransferase MUR3
LAPASDASDDESASAGAGKKSSSGSSVAGSKSETGDRASLKDSASAAAHDDQSEGHTVAGALAAVDIKDNLCNGRHIYVQELPPRFNADLVRSCGTLSPWSDMCGSTAHGGFGPQLVGSSDGDAVQETGWYDTDVQALDLIFHHRIRRYECLTDDPSLASAVFVPFRAGRVALHGRQRPLLRGRSTARPSGGASCCSSPPLGT